MGILAIVKGLWRRGCVSFALLSLAGVAQAGGPAEKNASLAEQNDRTVDEAALELKREALGVLDSLAQRSADGGKDAELLLRRMGLLQEVAQLEFRVAHGKALKTQQAPDLSRYSETMAKALEGLDQLMKNFPQHPSYPRFLYLRAKAYQETGKKEKAIEDLRSFITRFPEHSDALPSRQALTELLMERKSYSEALLFLKPLMTAKGPLQVFAYDKASLCHFYQGNIPDAMRFVGMALATEEGSARGQLDAYQKNAALFYFGGFERKLPGYGWENAIGTFRKLGTKVDPGFMALQFSFLLRSKGYDTEYILFSDLAAKGRVIDETRHLDLLLGNLDYFKSRSVFGGMLASVEELIALVKGEREPADGSSAKAKKALVEASRDLQSRLGTGPAALSSPTGKALVSLYEAMVGSGLYSQQELAGIYFNLAELCFAQRSFEKADKFYQLALRGDRSPKTRVRALLARLEKLKQAGRIPESLTAVSWAAAKQGAIDQEVAEWLGEIADLSKDARNAKVMAPFRFEGLRYLYSKGRVREAVKGLEQLVKAEPGAKFALPALSLALDTYVASADWEKCHRLLAWARSQGSWKDDLRLQAKLEQFGGAVALQQVEQAYQQKDFAKVTNAGQEVLRRSHPREAAASILAMAANAAISLEDKRLAQKFFSELKAREPKRKGLDEAADSLELSLAEEDFAIGAAAETLFDLWGRRKGQGDEDSVVSGLRKKLLLYSWLTGRDRVRAALNLGACRQELDAVCQLARARSFLLPKSMDEGEVELADLAVARNIVSLEGNTMAPGEAFSFLEEIAGAWNAIDPLSAYAFQPRLRKRMAPVLAAVRRATFKEFPVRVDDVAVKKRMDATENYDARLGKLFEKLPSGSLRLVILRERVELYGDLAREVRKIRPPSALKGADVSLFEQNLQEIVFPIERRQAALRAQIEEAERNSFCCDASSLWKLSREHFQSDAQQKLFQASLQALEAGNAPLLAFLAQEGRRRGLLADGLLDLMAAAVEASAGEKGEALALFESSSQKLGRPPGLLLGLLLSYAATGQKGKQHLTAQELAKSGGLAEIRLSQDQEKALRKLALPEPRSDLSETVAKILQKADHDRGPASSKEVP